jgi:hypothetical protein
MASSRATCPEYDETLCVEVAWGQERKQVHFGEDCAFVVGSDPSADLVVDSFMGVQFYLERVGDTLQVVPAHGREELVVSGRPITGPHPITGFSLVECSGTVIEINVGPTADELTTREWRRPGARPSNADGQDGSHDDGSASTGPEHAFAMSPTGSGVDAQSSIPTTEMRLPDLARLRLATLPAPIPGALSQPTGEVPSTPSKPEPPRLRLSARRPLGTRVVAALREKAALPSSSGPQSPVDTPSAPAVPGVANKISPPSPSPERLPSSRRGQFVLLAGVVGVIATLAALGHVIHGETRAGDAGSIPRAVTAAESALQVVRSAWHSIRR